MDSVISALRPIRFRGKYRLMKHFAPRDGIRPACIFGYRMNLDLADWIQRNIYLGSYEQQQTAKLLSHLRSRMTFVDVGANVGYYTALASSIVGTGRVISYEPNPDTFHHLDEWVRDNRAKNITLVNAALGSTEGMLTTHFAEGENHTASLVVALAPSDTRKKTVVTVRTLDTETERLSIQHIDVMKIDVDGFESEVLKGASRLLREGRIGAILCEFSEDWLDEVGSSSRELAAFLTARGFIQRGTYGPRSLNDRWFVRG